MQEIVNVLNILSPIAVLGALIFAGLQVRSANRARAEQAAVAVVQAVQTPAWMHSLRTWQHVPIGSTPQDIDALGIEVVAEIETYGVQVETVAYMVFRGVVGIEVVQEMIGGAVVTYWKRFSEWIELDRKRTSNPRNYEWVQWLVERLQERYPGYDVDPAYVRYARWNNSRHLQ